MTLKIKNTGEITLEQLNELKQKGIRLITIDDGSSEQTYNIDIFILIKKKLLEYIKNVPKVSQDDPDKDKKIFTYLYIKIAQNISYSEKAAKCADYVGYEREMTEHIVEEASNLIGGLLYGESMCRGYSEILRNLLSEVGINATVISGGGKTRGDNMPSHSWNQVQLDGIWYNCDITNDADFINSGLKLPLFLKSNVDFGKGDKNRYQKYSPKNQDMVELAASTISDEQQEKLINEQKQNITNELKIEEKNGEDEIKKFKSFTQTLKKFFQRKKIRENEGEIDR